MELHLSQNIRRHRQALSLSQEQLAARLGVSFQTVSKWERAESYPDITLLPKIAGFFHITVDGLLGVDTLREEEEVDAIIARCREADCHYRFDEIAPLCEEGLSRFPNNHRLLCWLSSAIQKSDPARAVSICDDVLTHSTDTSLRSWLERTRCHALYNMGETEKAIAAAKTLPNYYDTQEDVLRNFLDGDELLCHVQDNIILKLGYEFWLSVRKLANSYAPGERIALYDKSNAVYDALFETDDLAFKLTRKARNFQGMAEEAFLMGDCDRAFAYLRLCADCACKHDALPDVVSSGALLFRAHPYDRRHEGYPCLRAELQHDLETEDVFYAGVRETAEYAEILSML